MDDASRMLIDRAAEVAEALFAGPGGAHRPCSIALAETFGRDPRAYIALRRGGLTGEHTCGAVLAGELILGDLLGGDPLGPAPPALLAAITDYRRLCAERLEAGESGLYICNELVARFTDFRVPPRAAYCQSIVARAAAIVAEVALTHGAEVTVADLPAGEPEP